MSSQKRKLSWRNQTFLRGQRPGSSSLWASWTPDSMVRLKKWKGLLGLAQDSHHLTTRFSKSKNWTRTRLNLLVPLLSKQSLRPNSFGHSLHRLVSGLLWASPLSPQVGLEQPIELRGTRRNSWTDRWSHSSKEWSVSRDPKPRLKVSPRYQYQCLSREDSTLISRESGRFIRLSQWVVLLVQSTTSHPLPPTTKAVNLTDLEAIRLTLAHLLTRLLLKDSTKLSKRRSKYLSFWRQISTHSRLSQVVLSILWGMRTWQGRGIDMSTATSIRWTRSWRLSRMRFTDFSWKIERPKSRLVCSRPTVPEWALDSIPRDGSILEYFHRY